MTKQERAEQAELADQLAEEMEGEEEVEQDEEIKEEETAEQEDETPDENPEDVVDYGDEDEIAAILDGIDFNIEGCVTQDTITTKILYLCNQEKNVLDKFKENNKILDEAVYDELYQTIITTFDNYISILKSRLDIKVKTAKLRCAMDRLKYIVGDLRRDKINNKYQVKLLKYNNWLYGWKKWHEYRIARKNAKLAAMAELKALKEASLPAKVPP